MTKREYLLPKNDIHRRIIHLDMDAFYASVEVRDHPEYRKMAVIVGQDPRTNNGHGVIATANYIARKYGVHSAMPSIKALQLIPHNRLIIIQPNFDKYRKASSEIHELMHEYTDLVQSVSLDEAYLDVTENKKGITSAIVLASELQSRIYHELGLTCSFGVTYNKFIAKLGSEYAKPFGRAVILPEEAQNFLDSKQIDAFPGIGPKTQAKLHEMNIFTGKDLRKTSVRTLVQTFKRAGYIIAEHAHGIDLSPVIPDSEQNRKSIGVERTYEPVLHSEQEALSKLRQYSERVALELQKRDFYAKTVVLKIRNNAFETSTRRAKLDKPSSNEIEIYNTIRNLFTNNQERQYLNDGIRLLGVTATDFIKKNYQQVDLF